MRSVICEREIVCLLASIGRTSVSGSETQWRQNRNTIRGLWHERVRSITHLGLPAVDTYEDKPHRHSGTFLLKDTSEIRTPG